MCDSCSVITYVLERRGRHHAQRRLLKRILQTLCRWMLTPCTVKVARVKARTKVTETNTTAKVKVNSQSNNDAFDRHCNQCGEYGHKKPDCAGKSKFVNGTCDMCGAHGHKRVDSPTETVAHLQSESVTEPNED